MAMYNLETLPAMQQVKDTFIINSTKQATTPPKVAKFLTTAWAFHENELHLGVLPMKHYTFQRKNQSKRDQVTDKLRVL